MNTTLSEVLRIFEGMRNVLERNGWYVDKPESPKWWGGAQSPDEVVITAILVQQTRWEVVVSVLEDLRRMGLNKLQELCQMSINDLVNIIKGVNYRFMKARRLINMACVISKYGGLDGLKARDDIKELLMSLEGVGKETADSILLFALNIITLPVSSYTQRVMSRLLNVRFRGYDEWKDFLESSLPRDLYAYKLFHAGIVTIGKEYCFKENPQCSKCPLRELCNYARSHGL